MKNSLLKKEVVLLRFWQDEKQTTGTLIVIDNEKNKQPVFIKPCVERGDRNNEKNVSCFLEGSYDLVYEYSPKFGQKLWEVKGTPGRSECKIHPANKAKDLNGCIAPGDDLKDINQDGYFDVTNSKATVELLHEALRGIEKTKIHVVDLIF